MKTDTFYNQSRKSLINIWRNRTQSIGSIFSVMILILLIGFVFTLVTNINKLTKDVSSDVNIRVMVKKNTTRDDETVLGKSLRSIDGVEGVTFSSKESELKKVEKSYGGSMKLYGDDENPLYDVYVVKAYTSDMVKKISSKAKKLPNVEEATYGGKSAEMMFNGLKSMRLYSMLALLIFLILSLVLISNTIRNTIVSRKEEIKMMRLIGSSPSYIRLPFLLEGAWVGIIGSVIPLVIINYVYFMAYNSLNIRLNMAEYRLYAPVPYLILLNIGIILIATFIGIFGASISTRKALKA